MEKPDRKQAPGVEHPKANVGDHILGRLVLDPFTSGSYALISISELYRVDKMRFTTFNMSNLTKRYYRAQ